MSDARGSTHTLTIVLDDIEPQVWRRFRIATDATLADLHAVVQIVMGWDDAHLHELSIGDDAYGPIDEDADDDLEDELDVTLRAVAPLGATLTYTYDFGDSWVHTITVEAVDDDVDLRPVLLDGERACPPEDIGGPRAYQKLLAGGFDGERFDRASIERVLANVELR